MTAVSEQLSNKIERGNFTCIQAGDLSSWEKHEIEHPAMKKPVRGKLFLKELLNLTGMEISLNKLRPGLSVPFSHSHKENEEVYIFVGGTGQMLIDDETIDVSEGTVVRIAPSGVRSWRNNSQTDLYYIVIQARENSLRQYSTADGIRSPETPNWP